MGRNVGWLIVVVVFVLVGGVKLDLMYLLEILFDMDKFYN